jgi:hypothetical protein
LGAFDHPEENLFVATAQGEINAEESSLECEHELTC